MCAHYTEQVPTLKTTATESKDFTLSWSFSLATDTKSSRDRGVWVTTPWKSLIRRECKASFSFQASEQQKNSFD